ncbi:4Fe-4S ferredoxin [Candidatus Bathyarchaeota archaeon ex4484_205]|nr:MAG: 4Fe-4S ferredoxin [Candidatus Bathyarchaeota archaeon ex4484_205]RLF91796.1 MAG: 4Fe-4S ferredoxin [Thermococci archaeon]RLF96510.1 MAG: 4Fe-4S ferredoxin [Thermococci archaeon]HDI10115.1 4Fe-4S dicluster domain-containing protein [Euryarchaeota archaeon]
MANSKLDNQNSEVVIRGKFNVTIKPVRGRIYVIRDRCKGCGFCVTFCPKGVLELSEDFNSKGYHYPILKEEPPDKICINCGFCSLICPEFAIFNEED